ncbi:rho guanine nucleotide exchange factor 26 [Platysternon megacephalum]|uniref:Rho guanine nucleotide exchange factor 26 n=1 Tax=Platysternon megacephalum TaxID=55544 RepID=A0A4D9F0H3_9SAUR|nr:rho guanine nucleotide exchange factor 26 [Platysternon megacephalum]
MRHEQRLARGIFRRPAWEPGRRGEDGDLGAAAGREGSPQAGPLRSRLLHPLPARRVGEGTKEAGLPLPASPVRSPAPPPHFQTAARVRQGERRQPAGGAPWRLVCSARRGELPGRPRPVPGGRSQEPRKRSWTHQPVPQA